MATVAIRSKEMFLLLPFNRSCVGDVFIFIVKYVMFVSFIIWQSRNLDDLLIVFCLCMCMHVCVRIYSLLSQQSLYMIVSFPDHLHLYDDVLRVFATFSFVFTNKSIGYESCSCQNASALSSRRN